MLYNLAGGDMLQINHIRENFTIVDLFKWISIKNYLFKEEERANG